MSSSKLHHLISLAQEPSSERRRELLREVTDLFFATEDGGPPAQLALFDDVLGQLAGEMEEAVRKALAERLAMSEHAPQNLLRSLAQDSIAVAEPILRRASLAVEDQITFARTLGQDHLRALSRREGVSEDVTEALVERGDDQTLDLLLRNETAQLSRASHESALDRAATNPQLYEALVDRASLPADLLNEMYFVVEARLRDRILERNAQLDPSDLEAALRAGRQDVASRDGVLPADYAAAESAVLALHRKGALTPPALVAMLRRGEITRFLVALSEMAEIDFHTARRILDRQDVDALAIICKAAGFERALFLTFAVLILGSQADVLSRAGEYATLYADLPKDAALRTVRFWRMRRTNGDVAAA